MDQNDITEVMGWFDEKPDAEQLKYKIIASEYDTGDWQGDAFVLMEKDGKLFEAHGSHCSCYGLEGQWEEEETTVEALKFRLERGSKYGAFGTCSNDIKAYIKSLETNED